MKIRNCIVVFALSFAPVFSSAAGLDPITDEQLNSLLADLAHAPLKIKVQEKITDRDEGCIFSDVEIPVVNPNDKKIRLVKLYVVRPESQKVSPVVLIVPTIAGRTVLENRVSNSLCKAGIGAVVADVNEITQPTEFPAWGHEDNNHRWAIHALRTTIDFIQSHPNFDGEKIANMGLSLGGITSSMLIGIDERLRGSMLAAAGGNFPLILSTTKNKHLVKLRDRRMQHLKMKAAAEYEKELRVRLIFDPLHFRRRVKTESIMMMIVHEDRMVPEPAQRELWEGFGKPSALFFDQGHVGSLVRLSYLWMDEVAAFFKERFKD